MYRFLELSQPFRDAHFQPQPPTFAARFAWVLHWFLWVAACGLVPAPRPLAAERRTMFHANATTNTTATATATATTTTTATTTNTGAATGGTAIIGAHPSHLHGTPRQERSRPAPEAKASYIAAWERRHDAQFPGLSARLPITGGGLL